MRMEKRRWNADGGFERGLPLLPVVGTALLTVLAYLPAMQGPFLFDDLSEIAENPALNVLWPPTAAMFDGGELPHRPLPYYTFALNRVLLGRGPLGFHLVNLALHLTNGLLLGGVVQLSLRVVTTLPAATRQFFAWATATIWLVHPLQTQAVSYVYQRIELLTAAMCLLCLLGLAKAATSVDRHRSRCWSLLAIVAAAGAMASKESAVVLPIIAVLYDRLILSRSWRQVAGRWPLHAALAASWLVLAGIISHEQHRYPEFGAGPSLSDRLLYLWNQPAIIGWYCSLLVWPAGQSLSHGTPLRSDWWLAGPFLVAAACFGGGLWLARRQPGVAFLILTFFLLLGPTSSLQPVHDRCVEHRMYLPSAALILGLVLAVSGLVSAKRAGWQATLAVLAVASLLATVTALRNTVYASPLAAWSDAVAKSPGSMRAHARLATELSRLGRHAEAVEQARQAVAIEPTNVVPQAALAAALLNAGQPAEAAQVCEQGLAVTGNRWANPVALRLLAYLGLARERLGDRSGRELLKQVLDRQPDHVNARRWLAAAVAGDDPAQAEQLLRELLENLPADVGLRYDLGSLLARTDPAAAEVQLRQVVRQDPSFADAWNNIGNVLLLQGRASEARAAYEQCLRLEPAHPLAGQNLKRLSGGDRGQ